MSNQDIELKTNTLIPSPTTPPSTPSTTPTTTSTTNTMFILDQLDLLDQSESADVVEFASQSNNAYEVEQQNQINVEELDKVDKKEEAEKEEDVEDVRVLAYLQCKSLESYTHTELDKHLKKQHNVVFDKGGYINLYTKMFLAECKTCGAGWNMYSVDPPSSENFNVDSLGAISHVTPYKGYSVR